MNAWFLLLIVQWIHTVSSLQYYEGFTTGCYSIFTASQRLSLSQGSTPNPILHTGPKFPMHLFTAHTRLTGTAGRGHCVRIFTHFPCYEPACWSLNFMHFQTSVIRLVDRLTWFYRFGITLQINLSPKVCDLSVMFWINIYKLGLKKYPLKSRNFGNLVCLYLGYHGNYTRFICF